MDIIPTPVSDFAAFFRRNEHVIVISMMVLSGIAAVGFTIAFVHAARFAAPFALKAAAAKYPLLAAAAA
jgi:hypothetical protein